MPKTYNDLYLATRTALKSAGVEAYALEARLLVAYAVGKTKEEFVRDLRLYTSDENEQKIAALLQRRIAGEPLAYLIGEWEFHGLPIVVTPDVLIPRMDTEVLVDAALRVLVGRKMNARILDLCSGSGCIGCALAHELPAARVVMVDISEEAHLPQGRRARKAPDGHRHVRPHRIEPTVCGKHGHPHARQLRARL